MNNQQREKKSEIRHRIRIKRVPTRRNSSSASYNFRSPPEEPKGEDEIQPRKVYNTRSFPAKRNETQSQLSAAGSFSQEGQSHQMHAVQSYPSLPADAFVQVNPIPNRSGIMRTTTTARTQSAVSHYSDAMSDVDQELVMEAENPSQIPEATVVEVPSMHEQDGTRVIVCQGNGIIKPMKQKAFLYQLAMKADWKAAEAIFREDTRLASLRITQSGDTALHIAAGTKSIKFVRELVKLMSDEDLALRNVHGNTAFCFAAASGVVQIAEVMYERNNNLPTIRGSNKMTALYMAASLGNKEMVSYLYKVTPLENLKPEERIELLEATIHIDMFDLALNILNEIGGSTRITLETKTSVLQILARKPFTVTSYNQEWKWKRLLSIIRPLQYIPWMKRIHDDILKRIGANQLVRKLLAELSPDSEISEQIIETNLLHDAAKVGNVEFLTMLFRSSPELISREDVNGHSIFHVAVLHRQENVFNLIYDIGAYKDLIALSIDNEDKNNILHLAGKLVKRNRPEVVSGAALQMQRELLWFKEVEKIVPPSYLKMRNKSNQTPRELFSEEHQPLLEKGEKWMKETSNSCMLVATLIATVVFAAAFTVPGGSNNDTGVPIFLKARWFEVFVISDTVAMFTSTTSIIMFLSILTSRYAEEDFLSSLPTKLMFGLTALFVSILSMVVAFTATFFLIYKYERVWVPKLIGAFACIPVTLFALLQYKLWFDTIRSTYWSKFLFRPSKQKLY